MTVQRRKSQEDPGLNRKSIGTRILVTKTKLILLGTNTCPDSISMTTEKTRETWSSRTAFLLASIGAAVGFGNVWRFPALAYSYGGGAFFLPYILALVFIGIPLLVQEIAMGQHVRAGDVGVSNSINKRLRGVGLASVFCGFVVVTYYATLISWCFRALFGKCRCTCINDQSINVKGWNTKSLFLRNLSNRIIRTNE